MRTITKSLACKLTRDEQLNVGQQLAETTQRLSETQNAKKEAASQFKAKEDECNASLNRLSNILRTGVEYRDVECTVDVDEIRMTETTVRNDTGEVVDVVRHLQGKFDV